MVMRSVRFITNQNTAAAQVLLFAPQIKWTKDRRVMFLRWHRRCASAVVSLRQKQGDAFSHTVAVLYMNTSWLCCSRDTRNSVLLAWQIKATCLHTCVDPCFKVLRLQGEKDRAVCLWVTTCIFRHILNKQFSVVCGLEATCLNFVTT